MTKFKIDELKRVIHVDQVLFGIETFDQVLIKHDMQSIDMDFNSVPHIEILVLKNQLELKTFTGQDFSWRVGITFGKIPLQLGFANCFDHACQLKSFQKIQLQ